jgi:DNA-binding NarL/FixJ family response regulator
MGQAADLSGQRIGVKDRDSVRQRAATRQRMRPGRLTADTSSAKPRVLLAHLAALRRGMSLALRDAVHVCGEAATADEAIALAQERQPDICIVGRNLAGGGRNAIRGIVSAAPNATVIVLADSPDVEDLLTCIDAGAHGYLPVGIGRMGLRRAVVATAAGEAAVPRNMISELVQELRGIRTATAIGLTPREAQVLSLLSRGYGTATIAQRLGISPVTVRRHISATVRKTGSFDRVSLAAQVGRRASAMLGPSRAVADDARSD